MTFSRRSQSLSTFRYPMPMRMMDGVPAMRRLIEAHWRTNRSPVGPDTDALVADLAALLDADVLEAPSGAACLTWRVPEQWTVRTAQLRRLDGTVLADFADNPLLLWTHSVPFKGRVSRERLLADHIQSDPDRPDEFVYHYRNAYVFGARQWGFSLPWRLVQSLSDDEYEVEIDSDLDCSGSLKVVDSFLPGELPDTIAIMAHTCHPAQVADGIACIAVATELHRMLRERPRRRYSYRFLFGAEFLAGAVWLSMAPPQAMEALAGGIYLDMLTTHEPLGFQTSLQANSRVDSIARSVMASHFPSSFERPFGGLWGNDETFYNGAGFGIPIVGLGRAMHREYHYNTDDLAHFSDYHAAESLWALERMVEVLETDFVPVLGYRGPLYFSGNGLDIGALRQRLPGKMIDQIQLLADGRRSCMDIATLCAADFFLVREFFTMLADKGLAGREVRMPKPGDAGGFPG